MLMVLFEFHFHLKMSIVAFYERYCNVQFTTAYVWRCFLWWFFCITHICFFCGLHKFFPCTINIRFVFNSVTSLHCGALVGRRLQYFCDEHVRELGATISFTFWFAFGDADNCIFFKDMSWCQEFDAIVTRNRVLVHFDIIAMGLYLCCGVKARNDILLHFAIQWKTKENERETWTT